jgi:hypothetical protein
VNDRELSTIAKFLSDIDPEIPWHVFRLLPEYEMKEADYPSIEMISRTLESVRDQLAYVYFHNFGSGDMVELKGQIDLSKVDGIAISSHWSARYAGLHKASRRDLDYVSALPEVERVVRRDEWIGLFPGVANDPDRVPEHLLLAREGWSFVTTGTPLRKALRIPGSSYAVPVSTSLGKADSLARIHALIEANIEPTKIALIIVEGVGIKDFPEPYSLCDNSVDWYYYEPGDAQYLTLMTGEHQVFAYPSGYQYHDENDAKRDFPFSGYFLKVPDHTLGCDFPGRSIAVGNHSMFVHMVFGADICIECFARNLYNQ